MNRDRGFSYVELMIAIVLGGLLMVGMDGIFATLAGAWRETRVTANRHEAARLALDDMRRAVAAAPRLVVPLADDPATAFDESLRSETVGGGGTALLAVALDPGIDRDGDGFADTDNDKDGRIDEDWPADANGDGGNGILGLDDDGDGTADIPPSAVRDDDESGNAGAAHNDEDALNGIDDDGDGGIDEDSGADMNGDGAPGVAGVDDDADGAVDEGAAADDDEDGTSDEDWLDTVVFYLAGSTLVRRTPVPWDTNASGTVTGADYVESVLAEDVTFFSVQRVGASATPLVRIVLRLGGTSGDPVEVAVSVRVGSAP